MARFKSLKDLGKGGWKIASISPLGKPLQAKRNRSDKDPQAILYAAVHSRWPQAQAEYPPNIQGRKFRIDIAFVEEALAIELDGWQWHAKYLEDFKRDRRRQNLLVIHGWRVLRFTAEDIHHDLEGCLGLIATSLQHTYVRSA